MLVYFSGSAREIEQDITTYRSVIDAIQESGAMLALNWTEAANMQKSFPDDRLWWENICRGAQEAILDSDAVIVEASGSSTLGAGFEPAQALNLGKPVLTLIKNDEKASYTRGIKHPNLRIVTYIAEELPEKVRTFLREVDGR